jgi:hypothetical protein
VLYFDMTMGIVMRLQQPPSGFSQGRKRAKHSPGLIPTFSKGEGQLSTALAYLKRFKMIGLIEICRVKRKR